MNATSAAVWPYDAFISYSQAADTELARDLRRALQSLGKPFYRRRATRVALDATSMSADPDLWNHLTTTIDQARYFVLLASEAAANSKWVNREIAYFSERADAAEHMLIVLSDGELRWQNSIAGFSHDSTACPPALRDVSQVEPLVVDLRWYSGNGGRAIRRGRAREDFAKLAAPIQGRDKDEIIGDDIRQHRRNLGSAALASVILAVLAVLALLLYGLAENRARDERAQAVAALASAQVQDQLDQALLLAVAAPEVSDTDGTKRGLYDVLARSIGVERFIHPGDGVVRTVAVYESAEQIVTASEHGTVSVWSASWQPVYDPIPVGGLIREISVDQPTGRAWFASGSGVVTLVDLTSGTILERSPELEGAANAIAYDATTNRLFVSGDFTSVAVLDATSLRQVEVLAVDFMRVDSLALTAAGRYLVIGGRRDAARQRPPIVVFDLNEQVIVAEARDPLDLNVTETCPGQCLYSVKSVAAHPSDSALVAFGTFGGTIATWRFLDQAPDPIGYHDFQVARVRFNSRGDVLASSGFDHDVRYWDVGQRRQIGPVRTHHGGPVWDVVPTADGRGVTSSDDGSLAIGQVRGPASALGTVLLTGDTVAPITALARFNSMDGARLVMVARGSELFAIAPSNPKVVTLVASFGEPIWALAADDARDQLIIGLRSGGIFAWNQTTGAQPSVGLGLRITAIAAHPTEPAVVVGGTNRASNEHILVVLNSQTLEKLEEILVGPGPPSQIMFDNEGLRMLVGGVATADAMFRWPSLVTVPLDTPDGQHSVGFARASTGELVIGTDAQTAELFDASGHRVAQLSGHGDVVWSAAFQPSTQLLATGGGDRTVLLWDLSARRDQLGPPLVGHTDDVRHLVFAEDGGTLFSAGPNEVIAWNLDPALWADLACRIAGRSITAEEWVALVGETERPGACAN